MTRAPVVVRATVLLGGITLAVGCEYFRDTPEQELANRRWYECSRGLRDVKLERIDTDGRIRFSYVAQNERDRVVECLEVAGRDSTRLPEPLGSPQAGK